ncbi:Scr1 family TA system antitoxin-like transcriptional regulator [Actinomadura adrarensis]|uniref:Scr1 family TA system antitoxin-like transcriptional regulator n=1 Tax=Actinomadura adrarensis TaxID=1819600 RepID=A0ABW3CQW0_9ACTN
MPAQSEPYNAPAVVTFAKELEWHRTKAGLSKRDLAAKLGFTDAYLGQVELAKNLPSEEFADALDTFFQTEGLFHRLRERIVDTKHRIVLPPGFEQYASLESEAVEVHRFDALIVTPPLQTEAYARAELLTVQRPETVQPMIEKRLERQAIFTQDDAPHLFTIHDERALRTTFGNRDIMRGQLSHLLEMGRRGNIQHQVVPQSTGGYAGSAGSLSLLKLDDSREAAYVETQGQGQLILDPARVMDCGIRYKLLRGHALSVSDSEKLIESILEDL